MRTLAIVVVSLTFVASGCSKPAVLTVDVITDWRAGTDFIAVETEISANPFADGSVTQRASFLVTGEEGFARGVRVAELEDVGMGRRFVRVSLRAAGGEVIDRRTLDITLSGSFAATVLLTRSCRDVVCPGPSDPPELTECQDGMCVDGRCSPSTPELCPDGCTSDAQCVEALGSCDGNAVCRGSGCLCAPITDAGPSDSAITDSAPDAVMDSGPPVDTRCDTALLCDSFEDSSLPGWVIDTSGGTVTSVTSPVHAGDRAVRFELTVPTARAALDRLGIFSGLTSGEVWLSVRMFVPASSSFPQLGVIEERDTEGDYLALGIFADDNLRFRDPIVAAESIGTVPEDRWFCLEIRNQLTDGGAAEVFLDGARVISLTKANPVPVGGYDDLLIGAQFSSAGVPTTVLYLDDLVVSLTRAGCE